MKFTPLLWNRVSNLELPASIAVLSCIWAGLCGLLKLKLKGLTSKKKKKLETQNLNRV